LSAPSLLLDQALVACSHHAPAGFSRRAHGGRSGLLDVCTLAIYRDRWRRYPLVVAANRDEFVARPSAPPARLPELPAAVAGRDLEANGTWLGCRVDGPFLVAGLLNRRPAGGSGISSTGARSRGLLCLDALRATSVADVLERLHGDDVSSYGPFNLLLADVDRAIVVNNGSTSGSVSESVSGSAEGYRPGAPAKVSGLACCELDAGLSLLTNLDVNDPRCPRLASAVAGFERASAALGDDPSLEDLAAALHAVLSDHTNSVDPGNTDPLARLCIHGDVYGTRSSSLIVLTGDGRVRYFHAAGRPCITPLVEVAY
jgi:uncharacterized protein with NRDE domain